MRKLLPFFLLVLPVAAPAQKIRLTLEMLIPETTVHSFGADVGRLIDEQGADVDPKNDGVPIPSTGWFPGWNPAHYPASVIIDLRAEYDLTDVYFYDANGAGDFIVETGPPFAWAELFRHGMEAYDQWIACPVVIRTRYLRLTATGPNGSIPREIVLYGALAPGHTPIAEPEPTPHQRPTIDQLIGINAFIDDPIGLIEAAGSVREYHNWAWNEGDGEPGYPRHPANQNAFNPAWGGGGAWDFDAFYVNLSRLGVQIFPCIQGSVTWVLGAASDLEHKPIPRGADGALLRDPLQPTSYPEHADQFFQIMARYGHRPVDDQLLKLRAGQPRFSGLGVLTHIENWNEPDKTWRGRKGLFTPFEYAAMSSADLDGHRSAMAVTLGARAADPGTKLVMAGLTALDLPYLRALRFWSDHHRAGDFPFAALNFHHYATDGGGQGARSTTGVSPEKDDLRARLETLRDYRDRHLPGRELWLSEFGYDRASRSDFRAPAIGAQSANEIQARWIVRSWLALAAAGVDRGFQFMLRDVAADGDPSYHNRFNTSGLVGPKGDWTPRTAWFYQITLRQRLRGLRYHDELAITSPHVLAYRFANASGQPRAIVVWRETETDSVSPGISVPLPAGTTRVTRVELTPGTIHGTLTELALAGSAVSVDVTEKPVLLLLDGRNTAARPLDRLLRPVAAQAVSEEGTSDFARLIDEPALVGDPDMGKPSAVKPTLAWAPSPGATYPVSGYIDLGLRRRVRKIYLHDFNSADDFVLSLGSPGRWVEFSRDKLNSYASWRAHVPPGPTRHIRFTMTAPGANVAEVALYAESTSGYVDWAERRFPEPDPAATGIASPDADPDADGVSNLLEYTFGGDPNIREGGLLPRVETQAGRLILNHARDPWIIDIALSVEWSTDLSTWHGDGVTEEVLLVSPDLERHRTSIQIPKSGNAFIRLRVKRLGEAACAQENEQLHIIHPADACY